VDSMRSVSTQRASVKVGTGGSARAATGSVIVDTDCAALTVEPKAG
jgi:hypothetical protein